MNHQDNRFGFTILGSGSRGNATVIHAPEGSFLLDAGCSAKELVRRMVLRGINPVQLCAILLTHRHRDHISACRIFSGKYRIPVYMSPAIYFYLRDSEKSFLPEQIVLIEPNTSFELCGLSVDTFRLLHDVETVGYTFQIADRKLGYATDFGAYNDLFLRKMSLCHAIILESNHDFEMLRTSLRPPRLKIRIGGTFGHLSNQESLNCLRQIIAPCTKQIVLAHLSEECNRPALVREGLEYTLHDMKRDDIRFELARQDSPLETYWLNG